MDKAITQATLFPAEEPPTGEEMRDLGVSRVKAAADPYDIAILEETIRTLARSGRPFTAYDVRRIVGRMESPNLMGAMFLTAARQGTIERVRYKNSEEATRRSGAVSVWRGAAVVSRENYGKEEEVARDKEMLAIERINRVVDSFDDPKTRYRILNYCAQRAVENANAEGMAGPEKMAVPNQANPGEPGIRRVG